MASMLGYHLDITCDLCPMTLIKTKLLLEVIRTGGMCTVRLQNSESLVNISKSIATLGHCVLNIGQELHETSKIYWIKIVKLF